MNNALNEVTILIAQRAQELEAARDQFTADIKEFITDVLGSLKKMPSDTWVARRLRLDQFVGPEGDLKASSTFTNKYCAGAVDVRFKREMKHTSVGQLQFSIEFDPDMGQYCWIVKLVPNERYDTLDDKVWAHWKSGANATSLPAAMHIAKENVVQFVSRPVASELTRELALNDMKLVLGFMVGVDAVIADAVGADALVADDKGIT